MQALTARHCKFSSSTAFAQQHPRATPCVRARNVTVQAAATKASDFRRLTVEEIDQQVQDAKRELLIDFRLPSRSVGQGTTVSKGGAGLLVTPFKSPSTSLGCVCCRPSQRHRSNGI